MTSRRNVLYGLAALGLLPAPGFGATEPTLAALAQEKGLFFGAAASSDDFEIEPSYERLMAEQCDVWTPEWQFNWAEHEPTPGVRSFATADQIVAMAKGYGKAMRGHPFLWHEQLPDWVPALGARPDWEAFVEPYLIAKAKHFEGTVFQWDVVNEAIEPDDGQPDGLRASPFFAMLGKDYIARAFEIAREQAPSAKLYLNEYGTEYEAPWQEDRRQAALRLLEELASKGLVDGLGIQAHLDIREDFSAQRFADFLAEVAGMGLEITITELDVREGDDTSRSPDARSSRAAEEVRKVLAVALDQPAVKGVITWSLSDRFSWLRYVRMLPDNHGLPYDEALQPTPMRAALVELFQHAAQR